MHVGNAETQELAYGVLFPFCHQQGLELATKLPCCQPEKKPPALFLACFCNAAV